jgi:hypothetical protein
VLQADQIQSLAQYLEGKWNELHEKSLEIEDHIAQLKKELDLLNRKRRDLDSGRSRTEREAVLFVRKSDKKKASVELNYLVNNANWQQQYNLRANPNKSSVLVEYNAVVNQTRLSRVWSLHRRSSNLCSWVFPALTGPSKSSSRVVLLMLTESDSFNGPARPISKWVLVPIMSLTPLQWTTRHFLSTPVLGR